MAQDRHDVSINLTVHLLPPPAKGVILGQVPAGLWVNHAIKYRKILFKVAILVIVHTLELWVPLVHLREHVTLDEHETGRTVQNLGETIDDRGVRRLEVHHERCGDPGKVLTGSSALEVLVHTVPHHALLWITCNRNFVI